MIENKNGHGNYEAEFEELKGKTIVSFDGLEVGSEEMKINCSNGKQYALKYYHDCCATCSIEEIIGDPSDLLNSEILLAEEINNGQSINPEGVSKKEYQDSFTWTFYKLSTIKGSVTLRWYGESNGYYSESATFERLN